MPNAVIIGFVTLQVKINSDGIAKPSDRYPTEVFYGDFLHNLLDEKHRNPTHEQVNRNRQFFESPSKKEFEKTTNQNSSPKNGEKNKGFFER
jgi:hypothetical protein